MTITAKKANPATPQAYPVSSLNPGSSSQFEALFREHWPHVFGSLVRLVGDQAEAEDLALETFMRLYQNPPDGGRELKVGGWLHRVAMNLGLNTLRGWKRRERYELEAGRSELFDQADDNPAELQVAREEQRRVRWVLAEMNARQSQLLIMRHSGMAYQEIAAALGLSAASIGPLLLRAENEFEKRYRRASHEEDNNAPE